MVLAATDFAACAFSDPRLTQRFRILLTDLDARPACPLPQACRSGAALKAAYRFFDHPHTSLERLLPAFVRPSARRACRRDLVLAVHDSTSFNFSNLTQADGLGFLNDSRTARGIHLHSSLFLDDDCRLIGIAHLHFWIRDRFREEDPQTVRDLPIEEKESFKWLIGVRATHDALRQAAARPPRVVHVMDREGDVHEVFAEIRRLGHGAVIRCAQDRRVEAEQQPDRIDCAKRHVGASPSLGTIPLRVPRKSGAAIARRRWRCGRGR